MKIEKLSGHRLQVLVSTKDLSENKIDIKDLWQNTPCAQNFLTKMILKALESGELAHQASLRLSVEAIGLVPEGVIVILHEHLPTIGLQTGPMVTIEEDSLQIKSPLLVPREVCYVFNSLEDLILACKRLDHLGLHKGNMLHFDGKFHLAIRLGKGCKARAGLAILGEYGEKSSHPIAVISEYSTLIRSLDAPAFVAHTFE